jgi:hypothetical protein
LQLPDSGLGISYIGYRLPKRKSRGKTGESGSQKPGARRWKTGDGINRGSGVDPFRSPFRLLAPDFWLPSLLILVSHSAIITEKGIKMNLIAALFVEAGVVGAVCAVFLVLFVVAGVRQKLKDRK